jgi:iduronate 2-sulfatase
MPARSPRAWLLAAAWLSCAAAAQDGLGAGTDGALDAQPPPGRDAYGADAYGADAYGAAVLVKPNVLMLVVDDLKPVLGAYGDRVARTPALDALFARGVRFDNMHVSKAECCPSRSAMLTGKFNDAIRVWGFADDQRKLNPGLLTLPGLLRQQGYRTESVGKVFDDRAFPTSQQDMCSRGVPVVCSWDDVDAPSDLWLGKNGNASQPLCAGGRRAQRYPTDDPRIPQVLLGPLVFEHEDRFNGTNTDACVALRGAARLRRLAAAADPALPSPQPFMLAVGFMKPHMPWTAPRSSFDLFRAVPDAVLQAQPELATYGDKLPALTPWGAAARASVSQAPAVNLYAPLARPRSLTMCTPDASDELQTFKAWQKFSASERVRGYYATVAFLDAQVAQVLAALDAAPAAVRSNTMVVVWSDHGFHLGDMDVWGKKTVLEQATRVPAAVVPPPSWVARQAPDVRARYAAGGQASLAPLSLLDLHATVLDLAGVAPQPGVTYHAASAVPVLRDPASASVRLAALSQYESYEAGQDNPQRTVMTYALRTKFYRLVLHLRRRNEGFITSTTPLRVELFRYAEPGQPEGPDLAAQPQFKDVRDRLSALVLGRSVKSLDRDWTHLRTEGTAPFDWAIAAL